MDESKEIEKKNRALKQFLEVMGFKVNPAKSFDGKGNANDYLHVSFGELRDSVPPTTVG